LQSYCLISNGKRTGVGVSPEKVGCSPDMCFDKGAPISRQLGNAARGFETHLSSLLQRRHHRCERGWAGAALCRVRGASAGALAGASAGLEGGGRGANARGEGVPFRHARALPCPALAPGATRRTAARCSRRRSPPLSDSTFWNWRFRGNPSLSSSVSGDCLGMPRDADAADAPPELRRVRPSGSAAASSAAAAALGPERGASAKVRIWGGEGGGGGLGG
jgi:hypothetical protein